jgi:hypothetical protein
VFLALTASSTMAVANPYSFGGACKTQGYWTQTVMSQSSSLVRVFDNLKNDVNCAPLVKAVTEYYSGMQNKVVRNIEARQIEDPNSLSRLSKDTSSLFSGLMRNILSPSILANRTANSAINQMGAAQGSATMSPVDINRDGTPDGFKWSDVKKRTFEAVETGLDIYSTLMEAMADNPECVSKNSEKMGQIISSSVFVLSSFLSSGVDLGGIKVSNAISKLSSFMQRREFANAIGKINTVEFQNSMRCLLEVNTETYCSILDNKQLLNMAVKSLNTKLINKKSVNPDVPNPKTPAQTARLAGNPFSGIFILSHHLPNLTNFMQKIMLGADPFDQYDGTRKSDIIEDITRFQQSTFDLVGKLNRGLITLDTLDNDMEKRNLVFTILRSLIEQMEKTGKTQNFFEYSAPRVNWPFLLIGMPRESWPALVITGNLATGVKQSWDEWMMSRLENTSDLPMFNNPTILAQTIKKNLNDMIDNANKAATKFYGRWFLADKTEIIDQMFVDQRFSIVDSLMAMDSYLAALTAKINTLNGDKAIIVSINDSRKRIQDSIHAINEYVAKANAQSTMLDTLSHSTEVLSRLYYNFNILLSRTSFLANRLTNYVRYDYKLMMNNGLDLSDYQKNLLLVLGDSAMRDLLSNAGDMNQALEYISADLENATNLSTVNLEAIEQVFIDRFLATTAFWKLRSENVPTENIILMLDSHVRLQNDSRLEFLQQRKDDSSSWRFVKDFLSLVEPTGYIRYFWLRNFHADRYPSLANPFSPFNYNSSPDSTTGSAKYAFGQLCIQSLAFNNYSVYRYACDKSTLLSIFDRVMNNKKPDGVISFDYNTLYDRYNKSTPAAHEERVCAFRNYYRNNYVYQLTIGTQGAGNRNSYGTSEAYRNPPKPTPTPAQTPVPTTPTPDENDGISPRNQQNNQPNAPRPRPLGQN